MSGFQILQKYWCFNACKLRYIGFSLVQHIKHVDRKKASPVTSLTIVSNFKILSKYEVTRAVESELSYW